MYKKILTLKHGKHKGTTLYATDKTFDILYYVGESIGAICFFGLMAILVIMMACL